MQIFKYSELIFSQICKLKKEGATIGFVPTMGALHEGHLSLIEKSKNENSRTAVSIFVNPTQFNNPEDLEKYPRTEEQDLEMLEKIGVDFVFMPGVEEIYPEKSKEIFELGGLDLEMEGKFRPGHFNGVAMVVSRLFKIILPDRAYFGKKDFQQLAVINFMTKKYFFEQKIEIIGCEIIREPDGLAMSSRNVRLSPEQRKSSVKISQTLLKYLKLTEKFNVSTLKEKIIDEINSDKNLKTEYFEIVDNETLKPTEKIIQGKTTGCIAVFAGDVRLIDNISF